MGVEFDFSELSKLASDIGEAAAGAGPLVRKAVEVTARNVKDAAVQSVKSGSKLWRSAAGAIDYDLSGKGSNQFQSQLEAEIGYNKGRAGGSLGNLREYGAPNAPSVIFTERDGKLEVIPIPGTHAPRPPHNDLQQALHANEEDFVFGLTQALADAERKAGL